MKYTIFLIIFSFTILSSCELILNRKAMDDVSEMVKSNEKETEKQKPGVKKNVVKKTKKLHIRNP